MRGEKLTADSEYTEFRARADFCDPSGHLMPILHQHTLPHPHLSTRKKVRDRAFLLPLPPPLPTPFPKHHPSCRNSFPRCSGATQAPPLPAGWEPQQDAAWWHRGEMPRTCGLGKVQPKLLHTSAPAAHLLTTACDLFLVHMHRETERSYTGILSAVRSYGNKPI